MTEIQLTSTWFEYLPKERPTMAHEVYLSAVQFDFCSCVEDYIYIYSFCKNWTYWETVIYHPFTTREHIRPHHIAHHGLLLSKRHTFCCSMERSSMHSIKNSKFFSMKGFVDKTSLSKSHCRLPQIFCQLAKWTQKKLHKQNSLATFENLELMNFEAWIGQT